VKNRSLFPKLFFGLLFFLAGGTVHADYQGLVTFGPLYSGWNAVNTIGPYGGFDLLTPLNVSYAPNSKWNLYGQTAFADGQYTDSLYQTETQYLYALTQTVLGSQLCFTSFGLPSMAELDLTIPTGDPTWETKEIAASVPIIFINSRYADEGWGVSGLYALTFPDTKSVTFGAAAGYTYAGPYYPDYGALLDTQFKIGDSYFLAFNRVESFPGQKSSTFRFAAMAFQPTLENGLTDFQLGPNFTASYSFYDPAGFSWGVGGLIYTLAQRYYPNSSGLTVYGFEPYGSSGQQFYVTPSYAFGNFTLGGMAKFVTADGYPLWDASGLYDGGGWLFALNPAYFVPLDKGSALNFSGGVDYILAHNAAYDPYTAQPVDVRYWFWTLTALYEFKI
jgi:hypothetical protein